MTARLALVELILIPLLLLVTTLPIAKWVRRAYDFAREDSHRVTPQSPWTFFWRRLRKPMLIYGSINLLLMVLLALFVQVRMFSNGQEVKMPLHFVLVQSSVGPSALLSILVAALMTALLFVTRTRTTWVLMLTTTFLGLAIPVGLIITLSLTLPERLHRVSYVATDSNGYAFASSSTSLLALYTLLILSSVLAIQIIMIRGQGREWFWKEEAGGVPQPVEAP